MKHKIILLSVLLGLLVGFIDALLDYFIFYDDAFLDLLFLDIPNHEIYIRGIIFVTFILFGWVLAGTVEKLETVNRDNETLVGELQSALADIKKLSGFLPICAACKRIRDDTGYWNQIESYIRDHSEAEFTHSLCPECVSSLYPDLDIAGAGPEKTGRPCCVKDSGELQHRQVAPPLAGRRERKPAKNSGPSLPVVCSGDGEKRAWDGAGLADIHR